MYARLGRWCFDNSWKVIGSWIVIFAVAVGSLGALGGPAFDSGFEIPASESASGLELLDEHFDGFGGGQPGSIVFAADQGVDDPEIAAAMGSLIDEVAEGTAPGGEFEGLRVISPYSEFGARQISSQGPRAGQIAYADINVPIEIDQVEAAEMGERIMEMIEERGLNDTPGLQVEVGGAILGGFEPPESELLGLAFAVFVLIAAIGSVVAMGTTIGVAVLGVAIGGLSIALISHLTTVPEFATSIGLMIGLGVGIDYALFIVNRYREALAQGFPPREATAVALDTAGRSVIFAGATVVVSLLGLLLIGLSFITGLGLAASATVAIAMAASVTLLPAALGIVRDRVNLTRVRGMAASSLIALSLLGLGLGIQPLLLAAPLALVVIVLGAKRLNIAPLRRALPPRKEKPIRETVWYRWSRAIQARPWQWAVGGTALLLVLTAPVLSLRMGFSDEGNYSEETTTRRAYDLRAEGFGDGSNGPLILVTEVGGPGDLPAVQALAAAVGETEGVAFASPPFPSDQADPQASEAFVIQIQPTTAPQDEETVELVNRLRDETIPPVIEGSTLEPFLAGATAANIDFTGFLGGRILLFFGVVLLLSFVLLMTVFRSIMVPLKAVIMNMLSIGAAYGIVVAVFQWGWGGSLLGIEPAPIEPFIPMMMFAIVFGLSMDYEVFLLSRVKEEFERSGDPVNSVADGLAMTARVITAAAAIMVVVFGSFMFEDDRIIKLFGLGLAMAVLIDASLVRMLLVPSTMQLLGARNWWLPKWLDKLLPNLNVEGSHHEPPGPMSSERVTELSDDDPQPEPVLT